MDSVRIEGEVDDPQPAAAEPAAAPARPAAGPGQTRPTSSAGVMALQRLVGNAAVASMLQGQNPVDLLPEPDTQRAAPPPETTTEEGEQAQAAPAAEQPAADGAAAEPAGRQAGPGGLLGQLSWLPPEIAAAIAERAEEADTQQAAADGGVRKAAADASAAAASAAAQAAGGAAGAAAQGAAKASASGAGAAAVEGAAAGGGAAAGAAAGGAAGAAGAAAGGAAKEAAEGGAAGAAAGGAAKGAAEGGAAGAAAGGAAAGAAGGAPAAVSSEPAPRVDPKDDPNFNAMQSRTKAAGTKTKTHQPAAAGAASAQGAAVPPGNETASQAQAAQVEQMGEQEPGAFDRKAFIAAVKKSIEAATPKNLKEVTNFKESGKAAKVKGEVGGLVKGGKQASEKDMKSATVAPPDLTKATPKAVVPMENEEPGAATKAVGAAAAMPQPRPEEDTDLSSGPAEVEQTLEENEVTEEQLQKSNELDFTAALEARQEAKQHAETAPQEFRKEEEETLGQAREGAEVAAAAKLDGMHGSRVQALTKVVGQKGETKSKDEEKRAKVAADIQAIYDRTKADVTKTLEAIDPKVDEIFTKGEEAARTEFEDHVSARMSAYKSKRYSGWRGKLRWAKDKLFGMPDAVNAFYEEGKSTYLGRMEGVIGQVADVVGEGLTTARQRIADGRAEVRKYVAQLPKELQQVGKEAEDKLDAQFEELEADVDAKQGELVDSLAQKYLEARDGLDKRIEELKEANKGLVQKAIDKVVGVAKAIWRLKDMLLNVIAKAVSVIGDIIADPIGFFGNLVSAFAGGFNRFMGNIARHLQEGLTRWLFGTLGEAGIQMPKTLDLSGVFELVMQLLGLTYQNIRERVAKQVGEENVAKLEQKVGVFQAMVGKGLAGLWDFVKEKIGNFEDVVLGALKDFVIERVIKAGVPTLLAMLNPATAFIRACIAIYDFVMWLIDKGNEIMELINSLLDSISAIARGSIGEAVDYIEDTLAKALPLAISLLASVMRLGGLPEKIKSVIETVRKPIRKAVDTVIMGAVKGAKSLFGRPAAYIKGKYEAGKKWATDKVEAAKEWGAEKVQDVKDRVFGRIVEQVTMAGKPHTVEADADSGTLTIASKKGGIYEKAKARRDEILKRALVPAEEPEALLNIMELAATVKVTARAARGGGAKAEAAWSDACRKLIDAISDYGQRFNARDIDPPDEEPEAPDMAELLKTAVHVRPADYSRGKHVQGTTDAERRKNSMGASQFLVGLSDADIAALERDTLLTGELVPRAGGSFHAYKEHATQLGFDSGDDAFWLRAELSAGRIHSHPRRSR